MIRAALNKIRPLSQAYQLLTLGRRVAELESQIRALKDHNWAADNLVATLRAQADYLLSSRQVPEEMAADYLRWRAANPLPDQPLVSVCVATYNRARLLVERCISSVLQQTYANLELIVVGD